MRLFLATAKNDQKWASDGALDASFYLLASDLVSALMKADETLNALKDQLSDHQGKDGLRIRELREVGEVIDDVVFERLPNTESWVARTARQLGGA